MDDNAKMLERTAEIVAAYVTKNPVPAAGLSDLIKSVYSSLTGGHVAATAETAEIKAPAVSIKKSVQPDHIVCLEDGKKFKSLKRHLRTDHNMVPEEYRVKWNLPKDYPMVAPSYSAARSDMAKRMQLGIKGNTGRKPKG